MKQPNMKSPSSLPELLRHAAELTEKGESLAKKFEYLCVSGFWFLDNSAKPALLNGHNWRIADKDQHLLDDGWIRHTGNVCPVHPKSKIIAILSGQHEYPPDVDKTGYRAEQWNWDVTGSGCITHYKVTEEYVEPSTFEYKVGDKVFVLNKPYMSAPWAGTVYFYIDTYGNIGKISWFTLKVDGGMLRAYNCWKAPEDAEAFAAADLEHKKFLMGEIK